MIAVNNYGVIKIRKRIERDVLFEGIKKLSEGLGDKYEYNSATHITEEGYIIVDFKRVYLGKTLCIAICKNSKGRISLLVILKRNVEEEVLDKVVFGLIEITGGKFHKAV
jgi:hypothetical protein